MQKVENVIHPSDTRARQRQDFDTDDGSAGARTSFDTSNCIFVSDGNGADWCGLCKRTVMLYGGTLIMLNPKRFFNPKRLPDIQDIGAAIDSVIRSRPTKVSARPKNTARSAGHKSSYEKLRKFQGYREQLGLICTDLVQVLQVAEGYSIFPSVLEEDVRQLAEKVKSQTFRLAVVGEFSKGKSTFLNALLGEEIQPVRKAPCSGTLAVLKHGTERRVICHYKDGTKAVIPFAQYKQKASMPKEVALGSREKLPVSNIAEIVLEHPGLELCRHHVEIVDSPGLNEHSDRTAVTERLLRNADAAIFLTSTHQPLSKNEQSLLRQVKHSLQKGESKAPADNLFVLVNYMDALRSLEDKADVMERVKNLVRDPEKPLVSGDNRVHFISAQSALNAILTQTANEHSKPFSEFVNALETFLVEERGELALRKEIANIRKTISVVQKSFQQVSSILENKLSLSTANKQKVIEKTGEIGGSDTKIRQLTETLLEEVLSDINYSRKQWEDGLKTRLSRKSEQWITFQKDEKEIVSDYVKQYIRDFHEDVGEWLKETVVKRIVEPKLDQLTSEIDRKLTVIEGDFRSFDDDTGASLYEQFELSSLGLIESLTDLEADHIGGAAFFDKIAGMIGSVVEAITSFFFGKDTETIRREIKAETLGRSLDESIKASDEITEGIVEKIRQAFDTKAENFHRAADASISILCNLLEQKEKIVQGTLKQKEAGAAIIQQKNLQLQSIKTTLSNLTKTALG